MPLWTIFTKCPAPLGPQCSQPCSALPGGSPLRARLGVRSADVDARVPASRRSGPGGRPRRRARRPSGSSPARGRGRRRWCRRRGSRCRGRRRAVRTRSMSSRYHELPPSMIVSPRSSSGASSAIVSPTKAAGTIIHMWRGASSWATSSAGDERAGHPLVGERVDGVGGDVVARRTRGRRSVSRRTMLAPIRPSPIIPSCMPEACHVATRCSTPLPHRCSVTVRARRDQYARRRVRCAA